MDFLRKTVENVRRHGDIKLITTEARTNCLASEPNDKTTKKRFGKCISNRNKKRKKS